MEKIYSAEFYRNFLEEALSSLEQKENLLLQQEEQNRVGLEGLGKAWVITLWEDEYVEEFIHSFHETEVDAQIEFCWLEWAGVSRYRITIYRPGELFSL